MFSRTPLENIDTFVFDINGTLIYNPFYYIKTALSCTFLKLGRVPPSNKVLRNIWYSNRREDVIREHGIDPNEFWSLFNGSFDDEWSLRNTSRPYDDTVVIDEIADSGRNVAALTNAPIERAIIESRLVSNRFNGNVLSGHNYGHPKPSPEGLYYLIDLFGSSPERTVIIGNGNEDILCGINAGVTSVRIYRGEHEIKRIGENFTICSLLELRDLIGY